MNREDLFEKRFSGTLTPEEARELKRLLAAEEGARREFVRFTQERSILTHLAGRLAAAPARRAGARRTSRGSPWIFGALAAGLFVGAIWLVSSFSSPPPAPRPPAARTEETRRAEREMAEREASERRAREEMARLAEESRRTRERLAAIERDRQQKAIDEARRAEERRRAEEEMARIEARRREAEAAIEKAEAERRKAEEELARKREAEKPAPGATVAAAATIESVEGNVQAAGKPVVAGSGLSPEQTLESLDASSRAALRWPDGTRLEIAGQTAIRDVRERDAKKGKGVYVVKGVVTAVVGKQPAERPMIVATPHGEARVLGTSLRVVVGADTRVEVKEGRVRVVRGSDGKGADVSSGQFAVASTGAAPVARPLFTPRVEESFEAMPAWSSTSNAVWGSAGTWTIGPGQGGSALIGSRPTAGSSVQCLVYPVPANTRIEVSAAVKCPKFGGGYWAEVGFRLGAHKADDFDVNPKEWTLVKRFDNYGGQNGNGNAWTVYSAQADTGAAAQVTVGFKLGAQSSAAPTVAWDSLRISY